MLERNHSVGSASVGRVGEVKYDMAGSNANLAASSSLIVDEQGPDAAQYNQRVSEISVNDNPSYHNGGNNNTYDRLHNSDMSQMLQGPQKSRKDK